MVILLWTGWSSLDLELIFVAIVEREGLIVWDVMQHVIEVDVNGRDYSFGQLHKLK